MDYGDDDDDDDDEDDEDEDEDEDDDDDDDDHDEFGFPFTQTDPLTPSGEDRKTKETNWGQVKCSNISYTKPWQ